MARSDIHFVGGVMVWGMNLPSGFGEFWPEGDFEGKGPDIYRSEGWRNRLMEYYRAQTPEEQKRLFDYDMLGFDEEVYGGNKFDYARHAYPSFVCQKFTCEWGTVPLGPDRRVPYSPIESHEAPRFFQTTKGCKALGSLIKLNSGLLAVDEALKAIIERLEPTVHHFFPIEIRMPRGKVYPANYYTLAIGQYFDSFSPENSKEGSFQSYPDYPGYYNLEASKKVVTGLALIKAKFGTAHLWRERGFREWLACFSDEFIAEITSAGLRIPKHYKMKEV
jgi:hypothetical protein